MFNSSFFFVMKPINLSAEPYYQLVGNERCELFIDGVSRGVFKVSAPSKFYVLIVPEKVDTDILEF